MRRADYFFTVMRGLMTRVALLLMRKSLLSLPLEGCGSLFDSKSDLTENAFVPTISFHEKRKQYPAEPNPQRKALLGSTCCKKHMTTRFLNTDDQGHKTMIKISRIYPERQYIYHAPTPRSFPANQWSLQIVMHP
jgi:hypothetical protein